MKKWHVMTKEEFGNGGLARLNFGDTVLLTDQEPLRVWRCGGDDEVMRRAFGPLPTVEEMLQKHGRVHSCADHAEFHVRYPGIQH